MFRRLIESLEVLGPLTSGEREAVESLGAISRPFAPGAELVAEGDAPAHCRLLVEGQAFRHRTLADGRRQIMSFHTPGDMIDLEGLFLPMDHGLTALTAGEVLHLPHARLLDLMDSHPRVGRRFWTMTLKDAAIFREWILNIGRRTAYVRIAHLFCEVVVRLQRAGLVDNGRCAFPITQQHLSDATGLSAVHTNRTLQALRGEGLLSLRGGELVVLDWPGLQAAGEFDSSYLHLRESAA